MKNQMENLQKQIVLETHLNYETQHLDHLSERNNLTDKKSFKIDFDNLSEELI